MKNVSILLKVNQFKENRKFKCVWNFVRRRKSAILLRFVADLLDFLLKKGVFKATCINIRKT